MARKGLKRARGAVLAVGAAVAAGLALLGAAFVFAERALAPLVTGDLSPAYTSRVYAAPKVLRAGDPLSPAELTARLTRLGYAPGIPDRPGVFREERVSSSTARVEATLRDFSHPFVAATPRRVVLDIAEGRLEGLRLADGAPLVEAALEPEALYEVSAAGRVRRTPLKAGEAPAWILDAVVSTEDRRFREHRGVDPRGILRAAAANLRRGRVAQGGSTLTQQLAKNLFLTPRRTFRRKLLEAALALYLDARYSKDEILRLYLDTVYFGQDGAVGVVGLAAAAKHYFDKGPAELTLAECATLAGMLASPGRYDPRRDPEASAQRRRVVLAAMRRDGRISPAEERAAGAAPLGLSANSALRPRAADYFLAYVERLLDERHPDAHLMARGVTVHTTLDPWLQEAARRAAAKARHQAALAALDPADGSVRALVGGKDYVTAPFDRATRARRQPGSAFKPVVYAAGLTDPDGGAPDFTAASLLEDATRVWEVPGGTWAPRNYDGVYRGTVTARAALAGSLNAASVDLAAQLGAARIIATARRLGLTGELRPELGLALGASEVTLLELAAAYLPFANGGRRCEPHAVDAVLDSDGLVLEARAGACERVFSEAEAALMTDLLREPVRSGTAAGLKRWGLAGVAAGKTGTTDDGRDAWFIGYTPWLAAGVWTGEDIPRPLRQSGASAAMPVWAEFMSAALPADLRAADAPDPWPKPEGLVTAEVDPASGLLAHDGCPTRRTELFLEGTVPAEECGLHKKSVFGRLKDFFKQKR
jgi:penicillin-binding protein 1B